MEKKIADIDKPDFYLVSSESDNFIEPRSCWVIGRITAGACADSLLVRIDPPIIGQPYGLGAEDITEVILAPRLQGDSLFPVHRWPLHVYIFRYLKKGIRAGDTLTKDEVEMLPWSEIHPTKEAAIEAMKPFEKYKRR